jgi:hypothetical protein
VSWVFVDPPCNALETRNSEQFPPLEVGLAIALTKVMETLIDPFELHAPGSDPVPAPRMRPMMQSIVIDVEWEDPSPSTSSMRGVRVWATED